MNEKEYYLVWISHELNHNTPSYGGGEGLKVEHQKKISNGDSCNSLKLTFCNHLGTHVDAPYHFITTGKKINDYDIEEWIFKKVILVELQIKPNDIITTDLLSAVLPSVTDIDCLLIKTGFEVYRSEEIFWKNSPAFSADIALFLKQKFSSIGAIGFDAISLTGYQHRELGRKAHRTFLENDIRIFEDLRLSHLTDKMNIQKMIALPLCFANADASPCSIIAYIEK